MDDTQAMTAPTTGIGMTALGRIQMRVPEEDGFEEVVVERRWSDMDSARAWCERTIDRAVPGTFVHEIQVFGERWNHAKSWETTAHHPVAEVLQLGVIALEGQIRWTHPRSMSPHEGLRHLI